MWRHGVRYSAAADRLHDLHAVFGLQAVFGVLAARDQFLVHFDGETPGRQVERGELPVLTEWLLGLSRLLGDYFLYVLIGAGIAGVTTTLESSVTMHRLGTAIEITAIAVVATPEMIPGRK